MRRDWHIRHRFDTLQAAIRTFPQSREIDNLRRPSSRLGKDSALVNPPPPALWTIWQSWKDLKWYYHRPVTLDFLLSSPSNDTISLWERMCGRISVGFPCQLHSVRKQETDKVLIRLQLLSKNWAVTVAHLLVTAETFMVDFVWHKHSFRTSVMTVSTSVAKFLGHFFQQQISDTRWWWSEQSPSTNHSHCSQTAYHLRLSARQVGHIWRFGRQTLQTIWPLEHWRNGGTASEKHTGHSNSRSPWFILRRSSDDLGIFEATGRHGGDSVRLKLTSGDTRKRSSHTLIITRIWAYHHHLVWAKLKL